MKVMVIEIKTYQKINTLEKLSHTYIIIDLQKSDTWKFQLIIVINFLSSKDNNEEQVMHCKNENIQFTSYDKADKVIQKLLEPLLFRYQIRL